MRAGKIMVEPLLYSITDARRVLGGISRGSVYNLLHRGELTATKVAGRRMITRASLHKLAKAPASALWEAA